MIPIHLLKPSDQHSRISRFKVNSSNCRKRHIRPNIALFKLFCRWRYFFLIYKFLELKSTQGSVCYFSILNTDLFFEHCIINIYSAFHSQTASWFFYYLLLSCRSRFCPYTLKRMILLWEKWSIWCHHRDYFLVRGKRDSDNIEGMQRMAKKMSIIFNSKKFR